MQGGHAAKTPFADTPGGSSYHQISPNCRRTPPAKAPARILHRPHARGVRSHQTKQQKGRKCCQMGQLARRCARAWMVCHQTQALGRPHTPRPVSPLGRTPGLKSQSVEPTQKLLLDDAYRPPKQDKSPAQTRQQAPEHDTHQTSQLVTDTDKDRCWQGRS